MTTTSVPLSTSVAQAATLTAALHATGFPVSAVTITGRETTFHLQDRTRAQDAASALGLTDVTSEAYGQDDPFVIWSGRLSSGREVTIFGAHDSDNLAISPARIDTESVSA